MLTGIKTFLSGKKTYLVAIGTIIGVLVTWAGGSVSDAEAIRTIIDAVLACTIRAGISKTA